MSRATSIKTKPIAKKRSIATSSGQRFAQIRSRHPTHRVLRRNKKLLFDRSVIVRLGSTTKTISSFSVEINSVEAVRNCSDKIRMKELFKSAGVQSPNFYSVAEMAKLKKVTFPLVKKLRFRSRGQGMELIENEAQLKEVLKRNAGRTDVYFEEYFNGSREYRLHVSALGCFYTNRKVRKTDAKERWFFNSRNCNWLLETNPEFNKPSTFNSIIKECQKGLAALKLDFAAFDVRVKKDGTFMIIEGNSAPSFGEFTAECYLKEIPKIVQYKLKR